MYYYRYHTVEEIETAIELLEKFNPNICQRITLPNDSAGDSRKVHALKIGTKLNQKRDTLLIIGGLHARELVPPELCLSFTKDLLDAYTSGENLHYGNATVLPRQVHNVLDNLHVIIIPCANPDGREFVLSSGQSWRKNRSRNNQTDPRKFGVDLNRNYDFLFDFENEARAMVATGIYSVSKDPSREDFQGPYPYSEPETKNIVWLLDNNPIKWLIDFHGKQLNGEIYYPWGDDVIQTDTPEWNFQNPAFHPARGNISDTAYGEYMPQEDLDEFIRLGTALSHGIRATIEHDVLTNQYNEVAQSAIGNGATTGSIQDYAYSRHFVDQSYNKVFSFTLEHRQLYENHDMDDETPPVRSGFDPVIEDTVEQLIWETSHGFIRFCTEIIP